MNPTQLPLRDIHLPEAISGWPPAIGWWILAVLIPLFLGLAVWLFKRMTRKTALKTAKKMLNDIKQDQTSNEYAKLCRISELIRRVTISLAPRVKVASLTGQAWLNYLDETMQGQPFTQGIGQHLINAPYQSKQTLAFDLSELIDLCESWLKAQSKRKK